MAAHVKAGSRCGGLQSRFDVAIGEIGRGTAHCAEHVMVMALVAKLVPQFAVFQQNPADLVGFNQEAQSAIYGCSPNARQSGAEVLGGEWTTLSGGGTDHEAAGFGVAVPPAGEVRYDIIHDGSRARPRVIVSRVF